MTVSNKVLIAPVLLAASQVTLYSAPTGAKAIIDKATVTNTHATDNVAISVNLVAFGGSASATNLAGRCQGHRCWRDLHFPGNGRA
jgi:hypothetical protein